MMSIGEALLAETLKPKIEAIVQKYMGKPVTFGLIKELSAELSVLSKPPLYEISVEATDKNELKVNLRIHLPSLEGEQT
ncbi:hypothetical protein J2045_003379 [Peteryoungia aggregata LMG 23059]|uniref:Uncharacterized protein n=1 Tax=Peteryoungia aggregata LMG 23059 TaxID=1368425 RepID=A0ABU0GC81_9HYPH|nr:hypothetical protein [Peteryoungia aggregata]MDQ0422331.1 hypothetical protein [Peteryoungia aggregata LMG 23059]